MQLIKWLLDKLKRFWKEVIIAILAIFLIILFTRPEKVIVVPKDNTDLIQEAKLLKDLNGNLVSRITQLEFSKSELEVRSDSLARELKIRPKDIITVDRWNSKIDTQWKTKPVYITDSLGRENIIIEKHDPWIDVVAKGNRDTGTISLRIRDTLDRVESSRRKFIGFIGPDKTDIYLRSKNPYIQHTSGYSYTSSGRTIILTIGPYGGYDLLNKKVSVGVSVQVPLIKIYKPNKSKD